MKKFIFFLLFVLFSETGFGQTNAPMKLMQLADGCYFTAPLRVSIFQPIEWSVFITNMTDKTLRLDVCSSVDAM